MGRQQSVRWGRGRGNWTATGRDLAYALRACPQDAPEPPLTANDRHQQLPANMKLTQPLNPRATHGNTLVMRSPRRSQGRLRSAGVRLKPGLSLRADAGGLHKPGSA